MRLDTWLVRTQARLDVQIEKGIGCREGATRWLCLIGGFPNPTDIEPATFIRNAEDDFTEGCGTGVTPNEAYANAVASLAGKTLSVIGQGRDENHPIPKHVTAF